VNETLTVMAHIRAKPGQESRVRPSGRHKTLQHCLLYASDTLALNNDGTLYDPQFMNEVIQAVKRANTEVDTVFSTIRDPYPRSKYLHLLRKPNTIEIARTFDLPEKWAALAFSQLCLDHGPSEAIPAHKSASRKQGFVEGPLHSHLPEARFWIASGLPTIRELLH
jgi:hypothetical protein